MARSPGQDAKPPPPSLPPTPKAAFGAGGAEGGGGGGFALAPNKLKNILQHAVEARRCTHPPTELECTRRMQVVVAVSERLECRACVAG